MQVGDRRGKTEPEAVARARPAVLQPDEALQHLGMHVRRDARTVVRHGHFDPTVPVRRAATSIRAPLAAMADGVLHQVGEELDSTAHGHPGAHDIRVDAMLEVLVLFVCRASIDLHDGVDDLTQIHACEGRFAGAALDLGDAQERGEHDENVVDVAVRGGQSSGAERPASVPDRTAYSSLCPNRVNGVRRSWAISVVTCRRSRMSVSIRSSIALMLRDRRSNSSPAWCTGMRWVKSPRMMLRLVALTVSILRTIRPLMIAPPARATAIATADPQMKEARDEFLHLVQLVRAPSHEQVIFPEPHALAPDLPAALIRMGGPAFPLEHPLPGRERTNVARENAALVILE